MDKSFDHGKKAAFETPPYKSKQMAEQKYGSSTEKTPVVSFVDREALRSATIHTLDSLKSRLTEEFRSKFDLMAREAEISSIKIYDLEKTIQRQSEEHKKIMSSMETESERFHQKYSSLEKDISQKEEEISRLQLLLDDMTGQLQQVISEKNVAIMEAADRLEEVAHFRQQLEAKSFEADAACNRIRLLEQMVKETQEMHARSEEYHHQQRELLVGQLNDLKRTQGELSHASSGSGNFLTVASPTSLGVSTHSLTPFIPHTAADTEGALRIEHGSRESADKQQISQLIAELAQSRAYSVVLERRLQEQRSGNGSGKDSDSGRVAFAHQSQISEETDKQQITRLFSELATARATTMVLDKRLSEQQELVEDREATVKNLENKMAELQLQLAEKTLQANRDRDQLNNEIFSLKSKLALQAQSPQPSPPRSGDVVRSIDGSPVTPKRDEESSRLIMAGLLEREREIALLKTEVADKIEEIELMRERYVDSIKEIKALSEDLEAAKKEVIELQSSLVNEEQDVTKLSTENAELQLQVDRLLTKMDIAEQLRTDMSKEIDALQAQVVNSEEALANADTRLLERNMQLTSMQQALSQSREELASKEMELVQCENALQALTKECQHLRSILEEKEAQNVNLLNKIHELSESVRDHVKGLTSLQRINQQLAVTEEANANLTLALKNKELQLLNATAALTSKAHELNALHEEVRDAMLHAESHRIANQRLEDELHRLNSLSAEQLPSSAENNASSEASQIPLSDSSTTVGAGDLNSMSALLDVLKAENSDLRLRLAALQTEAEIADMQRVNDVVGEVAESAERLDHLQGDQINEGTMESANLSETYDSLKNRLQNADSQQQRARKFIAHLQKRVEDLQRELNTAKSSAKEVTANLEYQLQNTQNWLEDKINENCALEEAYKELAIRAAESGMCMTTPYSRKKASRTFLTEGNDDDDDESSEGKNARPSTSLDSLVGNDRQEDDNGDDGSEITETLSSGAGDMMNRDSSKEEVLLDSFQAFVSRGRQEAWTPRAALNREDDGDMEVEDERKEEDEEELGEEGDEPQDSVLSVASLASRMAKEMKEEVAENEALQKVCDKLNAEIEQLNETVQTLEAKNRRSLKQLKESEARVDELQKYVLELEDTVASNRRQMAEMEDDIEKKALDILQLEKSREEVHAKGADMVSILNREFADTLGEYKAHIREVERVLAGDRFDYSSCGSSEGDPEGGASSQKSNAPSESSSIVLNYEKVQQLSSVSRDESMGKAELTSSQPRRSEKESAVAAVRQLSSRIKELESERQQKEVECTAALSLIEELKALIGVLQIKLDNKNQELSATVVSFESRVEKLSAESAVKTTTHTEEKLSWSSRVQELQSELENKEARCSELVKWCDCLEKEVATLTDEIADARRAAFKAEAEAEADMQFQLSLGGAPSMVSYEAHSGAVAALQSRVKYLEDELNLKTREHSELQEAFNRLESYDSTQKSGSEKTQGGISQEVAELERENMELLMKLSAIKTEAEMAAATHVRFSAAQEAKLRLLQMEVDNKNMAVSSLQGTIQELRGLVTSLGERLEAVHEESKVAAQRFTARISELEKLLDAKMQEVKSLKDESEMFRSDLEYVDESKVSEFNQLQTSLKYAEADVQQLRSELGSKCSEIERFAEMNVKLRAQVEELAETLELLQVESQRTQLKFMERLRDLQLELEEKSKETNIVKAEAAMALSDLKYVDEEKLTELSTLQSSLATSRSEVQKLQSEVRCLQAEVAERTLDTTELRGQVSALTEALDAARKELQDSTLQYTTRIRGLQYQLDARTQEAKSVKDEAAMAQSDLEYMDNEKLPELDYLQATVRSSQTEIQRLQSDIRRLQSALASRTLDNDELASQVEQFAKHLEESQVEAAGLTLKFQTRIRDLQQELEATKLETSRIRDEASMALSDLQYVDEQKQSECNRLHELLLNSQEEARKLHSQVAQLSAELESSRKESDKMNRTLKLQVEELRRKVDEQTKESLLVQENARMVEDDLEYMNEARASELEGLQRSLAASEREELQLRKQLQLRSTEVVSLESEVTLLRGELNRLQSRLSVKEDVDEGELVLLRRKVSELQTAYDVKSAELSSAQQIIQDLHMDLVILRDGSAEVNGDNDMKSDHVSRHELNDEVSKLRCEVNRLQQALNKSRQENTREESSSTSASEVSEDESLHETLTPSRQPPLHTDDNRLSKSLSSLERIYESRLQDLAAEASAQRKELLAERSHSASMARAEREAATKIEALQRECSGLRQQVKYQTEVIQQVQAQVDLATEKFSSKIDHLKVQLQAKSEQAALSAVRVLKLEKLLAAAADEDAESAEKRKQLTMVTEKNKQLEKKLSDLLEENHSFLGELATVTEALDAARAYIVSLEEHANVSNDEDVKNLKKQLDAATSKASSLEHSLSELRREQRDQDAIKSRALSSVYRERDGALQQLHESARDLEESKKLTEQLQGEILARNDECQSLRRQVSDQTEMIQRVQAQVDGATTKFTTKIKQLRKQLETKTEELTAAHMRIIKMDKVVEELTQNDVELRLKIENLEESLVSTKASASDFESRLSDASNGLSDTMAALEESGQECESLREEIVSLQELLVAKDEMIETMQEALEEKEGQAAVLEALKAEKRRLLSRLSDLELQYASAAEQFMEAKSYECESAESLDIAERRVKEFEKEVSYLDSELEKKDGDIIYLKAHSLELLKRLKDSCQRELTREKLYHELLRGLRGVPGTSSRRSVEELSGLLENVNSKLCGLDSELSAELSVNREEDSGANVLRDKRDEWQMQLLDMFADWESDCILIRELQSRLEVAVSNLDREKSTAEELTEECVSLRDLMKETGEKVNSLEASLKGKVVEETRLKAHCEELVRSMESLKNEKEQEAKSLSVTLQQERDSMAWVVEEKNRLESEILIEREANVVSLRELEAAREELKVMQEERDRILHDLSVEQGRADGLDEDCMFLRTEVAELNARIAELEEETRILSEKEGELSMSRELNNSLEELRVKNDRKVGRLKKQLKQKSGEATALSVRIFKLDSVVRSLRRERQLLAGKIGKLEESFEEKTTELSRIQNVVANIKARVRGLPVSDD